MADILVLGAHPDDAEFGMGASIIKLLNNGKSVVVCVLTRGEAGTYGTPREREQEMKGAALKAGFGLEILDFEDCKVFDNFESRAKIAGVIRKHKPLAIFAPYHGNPGDHNDGMAHPDHITLGNIARFAARYARLRNLKGIGGEAWNPNHLIYYMVPKGRKPTIINDVSMFMDKWEEMVKCYTTQMQIKDGRILETMKESRASWGKLIGRDFGEAFISEGPVPPDTGFFI